MQPNVQHNTGPFSPASVFKLVTRKTLSASGKGVTMYRFSVQGQHLVCLAEDGIADAAGHQDPPSNVVIQSNVWVPLPIVRHALLSFVKRGDEGPVPVVCIWCFLVHLFGLIPLAFNTGTVKPMVLLKRVPRVRVRSRFLAYRDTPRTRTAVSRVFTGIL